MIAAEPFNVHDPPVDDGGHCHPYLLAMDTKGMMPDGQTAYCSSSHSTYKSALCLAR